MRLLSAIVTGVLLAAAFPLSLPDLPLPAPWGPLPVEVPGWNPAGDYGQLSWLAFFALIPLLEIAKRSRSALQSFGWGYLSGIIWLTLHWMWLLSFGWLPVLLVACWYALAVGLFTLLARAMIERYRAGVLLAGLPALWVGIEYLRSIGFWAFPWNLLGYSQAHQLPLIQVADLGGVYAVSFLIVLVNTAVWMLLTPLASFRHRLGYVFIAAGIVLITFAYGEFRLSQRFVDQSAPSLDIALVQGGLSTRERWSEDRLQQALLTYIPPTNEALASWESECSKRREAMEGQIGPHRYGDMLVVWPETVLPKTMDPRYPERVPQQVRGLLARYDDVGLLMGAQGRPQDNEHAENGCLLVEPDGELSWPYSKARLVAYGEVVPLKDAASFFDYPWGNYDLSAGRSAAPLRWREHILGLGVCFDNLFSYLAREQVRDGAGSLLLMTNNSWYKLASGIRQHCDMDILRAVEYRRPLARASTSGWSHIVLPTGKIAEQTQLNRPALLTAKLLPGDTTTPYLVLSDLFAQLCLLAAIMLSGWALLAGKSEGIL